jgi:uncharacterized protein DUF1203
MDYVISGLPVRPFQLLFGLDDTELCAHGAVRMTVDSKSGFPCRISLENAQVGETVLLLPWQHLDVDTPYRASGPIFVRETAREHVRIRNAVPEQQRSRLLSVRAYDTEGWMLDAEVAEGTLLEALIPRFFGNASVAYLHVHNARRGCYACRVDRG